MMELVKNRDFGQFGENWDRRNTSPILPKQDKKRSTSPMNELGETVALDNDASLRW